MVPVVSLDHYNGRGWDEIGHYGSSDWEWFIRLDGDVVVRNYDKRRTSMPPAAILTECGLMAISMDANETRMIFGRRGDQKGVITLTPTKYSVIDPKNGNIEIYPQLDEENPGDFIEVEDPSEHRLNDGPASDEEAPSSDSEGEDA